MFFSVCSMEFLFENEFKKHLQDVHKTSFIACGYKNCAHRVQAYKMSSHWSLSHGVSIYQCGHCKMNANDIKQMYKHFALFHQGLTPDILVRKHKKIQVSSSYYLFIAGLLNIACVCRKGFS